MAEELEKGMGGFYSILSKEFQPQYLKLKFHNLRKKYPKLPNILEDERIEIQITTGLEALGKTNDLRKMEQYFTLLAQIAQLPFVDINEVEKRIAAAQNFDSKGLIKDQQQIQAEQQQAQMMQLAEKGLPNGINQLGQLVQQQAENGNE